MNTGLAKVFMDPRVESEGDETQEA